jgi:hypothetical protein
MSQITNFTEHFKTEGDIFCQNISGCQVSISFELASGHSEGYLFPNNKDPVNLTRDIPFAAIKSSMDLRKMVNRKPPALRLMTESEYLEYFKTKAHDAGVSVDEAVGLAEERRAAVQNYVPLPDAVPPKKSAELEEEDKVTPRVVSEEDVINPRVLHLCLQVHPSLPEQSKMTAQAILAELDAIEGLTQQDWDYISSHGYYKSVIKLARKKVSELAAAVVLADKPKAKVGKK